MINGIIDILRKNLLFDSIHFGDLNPLTAVPAKTGHNDNTALKRNCNFLDSTNIALINCQLWALNRMSFKLGYPINAKKAFLQKYIVSPVKFGQQQN